MKSKNQAKRLYKDGIGLTKLSDFAEILDGNYNGDMPKGQITDAAVKIEKITREPTGNIARQLKELKKASRTILDTYYLYVQITEQVIKENERLQNCVDRNHKRWTSDEDEMLIESVTRDDFNPDAGFIDIARIFGRTPSAIKSRITYLVGVKKISQNVAGKFIGRINGIETEGYIDGVLSL